MKNRVMGVGILSLLAAGCAPATFSAGPGSPAVTLRLINNAGQQVGSAVLADTEEGVRVNLSVRGIPAGVHGFHIHENGMCDPPNFTSAGSHYNPTGRQHG
ncbi:MAG TPA: superoxide dismutase family protein, partial [Longimicrobiaceae bacterium]|nr:superoxide dismutase family protein [Longimicrobiaceae bacterium]